MRSTSASAGRRSARRGSVEPCRSGSSSVTMIGIPSRAARATSQTIRSSAVRAPGASCPETRPRARNPRGASTTSTTSSRSSRPPRRPSSPGTCCYPCGGARHSEAAFYAPSATIAVAIIANVVQERSGRDSTDLERAHHLLVAAEVDDHREERQQHDRVQRLREEEDRDQWRAGDHDEDRGGGGDAEERPVEDRLGLELPVELARVPTRLGDRVGGRQRQDRGGEHPGADKADREQRRGEVAGQRRECDGGVLGGLDVVVRPGRGSRCRR